ncbi:hypothetical protein LINGRAHAP2_LOCUS5704 [Linum grandiflorum]
MATENCISDCDGRTSELHRCPGKRRRISSEANLPPTTISELGADLLVEILIRLPNPRSACQCKLVCKRWASLISSPPFNRDFISHHQTRNRPHMPADPYELKSIILRFLPPMPCRFRNALRVLDCNNDLVLCGFRDVDCDDGECSRTYLVCNPFTKQWIALPLAPRKHVGYVLPAARLVCEPRNFNNLDLGDGQSFVHSEYRFRVVCIYQVARPKVAIKLDVFCSQSGEWTKEALVCDNHIRKPGSKSVISCNGELFWKYSTQYNYQSLVAVFNPFSLDIPPTSIDVSAFRVYPRWFISGSQGELHVIAIENETVPLRSSIWRLEEDRKSWRKQYQGLVNETSKCCNYKVEGCYRPLLHPHNPEIIFFNPLCSEETNAILCCNLRTEELEFLAKVEGKLDVLGLEVFQPRVSCWTTPIPRYDELRGMYDGRHSFWIQSSSEAKTHSLNICKDEVMKSSFYKDYIECATEEANRDIAAEIIQRRKNKISEIVLRGRQLPRFPFDKELDGLKTVLKDIEDEVVGIGNRKENLKQRLRMCKTSAELPDPPGTPDILDEIIPSCKRKSDWIVVRARKRPRFPDDKEADLKDVESYMAAIGKSKKLKQGLLCETSAELPYPPDSVKSVCAEVTRDIMAEIRERKNKISEFFLRERQQPRFPNDEEADLKAVESYIAAIGNPEQLKDGVLYEASGEFPHPLVPINRYRLKNPHRYPSPVPESRIVWEKRVLGLLERYPDL